MADFRPTTPCESLPEITAEEFERQYAARSGITVEKLREFGRVVAPCDCGEDLCQGWQSINGDDLERFHEAARG